MQVCVLENTLYMHLYLVLLIFVTLKLIFNTTGDHSVNHSSAKESGQLSSDAKLKFCDTKIRCFSALVIHFNHNNYNFLKLPLYFILIYLKTCNRTVLYIEGFHGSHVGGLKQFCMKIDLISQGRENVLFLPSNMAAMTSHENAL